MPRKRTQPTQDRTTGTEKTPGVIRRRGKHTLLAPKTDSDPQYTMIFVGRRPKLRAQSGRPSRKAQAEKPGKPPEPQREKDQENQQLEGDIEMGKFTWKGFGEGTPKKDDGLVTIFIPGRKRSSEERSVPSLEEEQSSRQEKKGQPQPKR